LSGGSSSSMGGPFHGAHTQPVEQLLEAPIIVMVCDTQVSGSAHRWPDHGLAGLA